MAVAPVPVELLAAADAAQPRAFALAERVEAGVTFVNCSTIDANAYPT